MFDMFKKIDDEQNDGEQNSPEQCLTLEENHEETNQNEELKPQEPIEKTETDVLATLKALGAEELLLLAEKLQLVNMEETLKQRITDKIEIKSHKYEIPELKQRCEALAKALDIPVQK